MTRLRKRREGRGGLLAAVLVGILGWVHGQSPGRAPAVPVSVQPTRTPTAAMERTDLNRATPLELQSLPGIGPVLAARIVEHRLRYGPFETVDELRAVRGIGPRLLDRMRAMAAIGARTDSLLP